jgi:DNA-binding GntR family transcriptional regulator
MSLRAETAHLEESNVEHGQMIDAYECHDADAATALTESHLRSTLEIIEAYERRGAD